jgi:hypothetical protein
MRRYQRASRMPRRAAGVLAAAASLAATAGAAASPAAVSWQAGAPAAPGIEKVAAGAASSLGEPAAAQDGAVTAVTATSFGTAGAQAKVWTMRAGETAWRQAGAVLPAGFGSSYDPAAAAAPGGPLLMVAGTAPPGEQCITNGSVAIASVGADGALGTARLVSDQRGTGSFDDRPAVAVGQHGTVWVAWSQGPDAEACQNVGDGDRIEVAVSRDGGLTFGDPVAMPADGGHAAFGVRIAPLTGGQAAVSWTETTAAGGQAVLVSVLGTDGHPGQPAVALTGDGPPLTLPGASFYDFPAGDLAALSDGKLAVAAPFWVSGRSVIKLAAGLPGGGWQETDLSPPAGADLLLPAIGVLSPGGVRLLCAVHTRLDDRLGYDWADVTLDGQAPAVSRAGLTALTPAPPGPGFFEIGEELALARTPRGLLTAVVVAGRDGAALETAVFSAPPAAIASPGRSEAPSAAPTTRPPGTPAASGRAAPGTGAARAANGSSSGLAVTAAWLGAAALCGAAATAALLLRRRRRPSGGPPATHRPPSHGSPPSYRSPPSHGRRLDGTRGRRSPVTRCREVGRGTRSEPLNSPALAGHLLVPTCLYRSILFSDALDVVHDRPGLPLASYRGAWPGKVTAIAGF